MNEKYDAFINSFIDKKIGLCNFFLTPELAKHLQRNLEQLDQENKMFSAGIGNNLIKDHHQKQRGDKIYWLDKKNKDIHELAFLEEVENFIEYLNKTCYTGINAYEFHYALYETGSYYHRHKDQFKNNQDRKYTLINYLNDDWQEADGGALLVYQDDQTETILPTIQKAIFFQSSELEHEVAIAHRPRMSISGWLKRI
jgi:SM-20-related protein